MADQIPDSTKLLPCPFCGADAQIERGSDHHGAWFNLGCSRHWGSGLVDADDGCIGGRIYYTETETPEAEAIAAWNTRAAPPAMDREAVERAVDVKQSIIRQLSVQPDYDRVILSQTDWDIVLSILSTLSADAIRQGEAIGLDGIKRLWRIGVETGSILERANPQPWCSGVATDVPAGEVRRAPDDPDWDKCPACKTGSLDTGYECNACGFDAQPLVHFRDACAARGERMHPSGLYESEIAHPFPATPASHASDGGEGE